MGFESVYVFNKAIVRMRMIWITVTNKPSPMRIAMTIYNCVRISSKTPVQGLSTKHATFLRILSCNCFKTGNGSKMVIKSKPKLEPVAQ